MTFGPEFQAAVAELLIAAVQLVFIVLAGYAVKWVQANVSRKQMDLAVSIAHVAVAAIEQLAASGQIDYKRKMEFAIEMARDQAGKYGLAFTDDQWTQLIEAAVKAMKDAGEEIKAAPAA